MNKEQAFALRNLLSSVVPDGKVSRHQLDALVVYVSEVATSENDALDRISSILDRSVGNEMGMRAMAEVNFHKARIDSLEKQIDVVRSALPPPESKKLVIIQSIFIAISFIAAVVSLTKAFGFLVLPW